MPIIFHKLARGWNAERVSASAGFLTLAPVRFDPYAETRGEPPPSAGLLVRADVDGPWVLLARRDRRPMHNGQLITSGIRVLEHRDSVALEGSEAVYFSTEETARIEPFTGSAEAVCPRCRSEVLPGQPAVKCPRCGVFHHEMADRNCWTYARTCAVCAQPTALDSGPQWTPETL